MKREYTVIDLFSGAGGLSQGFLQAGFKVLVGIDFDEAALKTYAHNIVGAKALKEDLFQEEVAINNIAKELGNTSLDVIIDTRNKLYLAVVHAVDYFKPKVFLIENVPGMATLYKGKVKEQIINTFEDMGYNVSVTDKPLLAADYGVPQFRKRMFFVGFRKDLNLEKFVFPKPILDEDSYIGTAAAISDLQSL